MQSPVSAHSKSNNETESSSSGDTPSPKRQCTIPDHYRKLNFKKEVNEQNFEWRLENLLSNVEHCDVIYKKVILGVEHLMIVNWKVFECVVLVKCKLWGRIKRYTSFNRQVMEQGYQKVKLQTNSSTQKVVVYLRAVDKQCAPKSHIPCFIPVKEIKRKQAALEIKYKNTLSSVRKMVKLKRCQNNCRPILRRSKSTMTEEIIKEFNNINFNNFTKTMSKRTVFVNNSKTYSDSNKHANMKIENEIKNSNHIDTISISENQNNAESLTAFSFNLNTPRHKITLIPFPNFTYSKNKIRVKEVTLHFLMTNLINETVESLLKVTLSGERRADVLLWDPTKLKEEVVVEYLENCANVDKNGELEFSNSYYRKPDDESHLRLLHNCDYDKAKALYSLQNKTHPHDFETKPNQEIFGKIWTNQMKMNFEKGLIIYGEKMEDILDHFSSFTDLTPLHLELYFCSNSRYNFITDSEISKKIVEQLDKTSHKHLQSIETFEVSTDWARIRQIVHNLQTSSDSDNNTLITVNQYGRVINQVQKGKKRPKRLPNRFKNYQINSKTSQYQNYHNHI